MLVSCLEVGAGPVMPQLTMCVCCAGLFRVSSGSSGDCVILFARLREARGALVRSCAAVGIATRLQQQEVPTGMTLSCSSSCAKKKGALVVITSAVDGLFYCCYCYKGMLCLLY